MKPFWKIFVTVLEVVIGAIKDIFEKDSQPALCK